MSSNAAENLPLEVGSHIDSNNIVFSSHNENGAYEVRIPMNMAALATELDSLDGSKHASPSSWEITSRLVKIDGGGRKHSICLAPMASTHQRRRQKAQAAGAASLAATGGESLQGGQMRPNHFKSYGTPKLVGDGLSFEFPLEEVSLRKTLMAAVEACDTERTLDALKELDESGSFAHIKSPEFGLMVTQYMGPQHFSVKDLLKDENGVVLECEVRNLFQTSMSRLELLAAIAAISIHNHSVYASNSTALEDWATQRGDSLESVRARVTAFMELVDHYGVTPESPAVNIHRNLHYIRAFGEITPTLMRCREKRYAITDKQLLDETGASFYYDGALMPSLESPTVRLATEAGADFSCP